jgi:hypothetical protein
MPFSNEVESLKLSVKGGKIFACILYTMSAFWALSYSVSNVLVGMEKNVFLQLFVYIVCLNTVI